MFFYLLFPFKQSPRTLQCPALTLAASLTPSRSDTVPRELFPLPVSRLISTPDVYLPLPHLSRGLVSSPVLVLTLSNVQPFSAPRLRICKTRSQMVPFGSDIPPSKVSRCKHKAPYGTVCSPHAPGPQDRSSHRAGPARQGSERSLPAFLALCLGPGLCGVDRG